MVKMDTKEAKQIIQRYIDTSRSCTSTLFDSNNNNNNPDDDNMNDKNHNNNNISNNSNTNDIRILVSLESNKESDKKSEIENDTFIVEESTLMIIISNDEFIKLIDCIKFLFNKILLPTNNEDMNIDNDDDSDDNNNNRDEIIKQFHEIFPLVMNTIRYSLSTTTNLSSTTLYYNTLKPKHDKLLHFLLKDLLPMMVQARKQSQSSSTSLLYISQLLQDRNSIIHYIIIEMIPIIIRQEQWYNNLHHYDDNTHILSIENEIIDLLQKCLFHHNHSNNNNNNTQQPQPQQKEQSFTHSMTILPSIQSILNLFQKYDFQNKLLIISFLHDCIISEIIQIITLYNKTCTCNDDKEQQGNIHQGISISSENELKTIITILCHVLFKYLLQCHVNESNNNNSNNNNANCTNTSNNNKNSKSNKKYGGNTTKSRDHDDDNNNSVNDNLETTSIKVLQLIRKITVLLTQHPHDNSSFKRIEMNILHIFISYMVQSSSIAKDYLVIIKTNFAEKDNQYKNMKHKYQGIRNEWTQIDICALLILYHVHISIHRKDAIQIINELCNQYTFPFDEMQLMLNKLDFLDCIDSDRHLSQEKMSSSKPSSLLKNALMEVGLYLLLIPIRCPDYPEEDNIGCNFSPVLNFSSRDFGDDSISPVHPIRELFINVQSLLENLFPILDSDKQEDLILTLLHMSSHTTFIPTMIDKVLRNKSDDKSALWKYKHRHKSDPSIDGPLPYNLDRFFPLLSKVNVTKFDIRHIYDVAIMSLNVLKNVSDQSNSIRLRRITIDRLIHLVTSSYYDCDLVTNHGAKKYDAASKDKVIMLNYVIIDIYCSMIVLWCDNEVDRVKRLKMSKENELLFHKLLSGSTFSLSPITSCNTPGFATNKVVVSITTTITSFILGKNMLQSQFIEENVRNDIFESIINLILPSVSGESVDSIYTIDPQLSYWGLYFLCSCCPELTKTDESDFQGEKCDVQQIYSIPAIFEHVKTLVALTGIVKFESKVVENLERQGNERSSILIYRNEPSCLQGIVKPKRNMTYCIATLERKKINLNVSDDFGTKTINWIRFTNSLLDIYLYLGRLLSPKWSADAWLMASIEIIDSQDDYDVSTEKDITCHILAAPIETTKQIAMRHGVSLLLSIASLHAVLRNSYAHYCKYRSTCDRDRLLKLLQFTIAKIYDLKCRFQRMFCSTLISTDDDKEFMELSSQIIDDLVSIATSIFDTFTIPMGLLWSCIQDKSAVWEISRSDLLCQITNKENIAYELWLKKSILVDMMRLPYFMDRNISMNGFQFNHTFNGNGIGVVAQLLLQTLSWYQSVPTLTNSFELSEDDLIGSFPLSDQIAMFISQSLDFLQLSTECVSIHQPISTMFASIESDRAVLTVKDLCCEILKIMANINDPLISAKVLDFTSLLSSSARSATEDVSRENWNRFVNCSNSEHVNCDLSKLPCSFAWFVRKEVDILNSSMDANKSSVLLNLLRTVSSPLESFNDCIFRHHLCVHWAHAIYTGSNYCREYYMYLESLQHLVSRLASEVLFGVEHGEDSSSHPIQSMDIRTIPLALELLLSMCTASFAISLCSQYDNVNMLSKHSEKPTSSSSLHEVIHDQIDASTHFVKVFVAAIELYTSNIKLFPERLLGPTIKTTTHMVKSFDMQIETYFVWNRDNANHLRKKGVNNRLLNGFQSMFDNIQKCANLIIDFCNTVPHDTEHNELNDASLKTRKAIASLEFRCEDILSSLHDVNGSHNYFLTSTLECLSNDKESSQNHKIESAEREKLNHTKHTNQVMTHDIKGKSLRNKRRKKNSNGQVPMTKKDVQNLNNALSDDDSDSFGVMGDWASDEES